MVNLQRKKRMRMMSWDDWGGGLPLNVMDEILDRLVSLSDYIRFSAVCVSWRSAALDDRNHRGRGNKMMMKKKKKKKNNQIRRCNNTTTTNDCDLDLDLENRQLPMLMLPHRFYEDRAQFYSVTHGKVLNYQLRVPYYTKRFIGSSLGWLISVDTTDLTITLFNPFSASTIRLPPFPNPPPHHQYGPDFDTIHLPHHLNLEYYFFKAILSADPASHPDEYVVMLIYGQWTRLAYIRPGAGAGQWAFFQPHLVAFCDIIYSKSSCLFYALCGGTGDVCSIDIDKEEKAHRVFTPTLQVGGGDPLDLRYVVETRGGDLLQVMRVLNPDPPFGSTYHTAQFKVFKLDKTTTTPVWAELKSLGDNALFVGDCTSICVAASDFRGCSPGSIYFSLPFSPRLLVKQKPFRDKIPYDMGVANIQEDQPLTQPFHINYRKYDAFNAIPNRPPIWVLPSFCFKDINKRRDY